MFDSSARALAKAAEIFIFLKAFEGFRTLDGKDADSCWHLVMGVCCKFVYHISEHHRLAIVTKSTGTLLNV